MAKSQSKMFACSNCGYESGKWLGQCPSCSEWGSIDEQIVIEQARGKITNLQIKRLSDIEQEEQIRIPSGLEEFDRVLGSSIRDKCSGFIKGQIILLSGDPGIGKSTILLQLLINNVSRDLPSLYVSAEESCAQIAVRLDRLLEENKNAEGLKQKIELLNASDVEGIISLIDSMKKIPAFVVIDSIQTVYSSTSQSIAGSMSQVRLCTAKLVQYAKEKNIILIIVGHINKEGEVAGPLTLQHMVDSVFHLSGEERSGLRLLRSLKNRFGPTMEVGMFQMTSRGLVDLSDPSKLFDSQNKESQIGVCRSIIIEGQRPLVIEVQVLTANTPFSLPKRIAEGVSISKVQRIAAILSKYAKIDFGDKDIYVKISGGLKVTDPAVDLAIAVAAISSMKNIPISPTTVALGELNLTGRVASVIRIEDRIKEANRLGYTNIFSGNNSSNVASLLTKIKK